MCIHMIAYNSKIFVQSTQSQVSSPLVDINDAPSNVSNAYNVILQKSYNTMAF